jgi:hypothetical protein
MTAYSVPRFWMVAWVHAMLECVRLLMLLAIALEIMY